ncbi:MAG: bifunctional hydroxymethylpyrimidine kinase/phosphomethylpyrimidine kinase [Aquificaceae bacterium]
MVARVLTIAGSDSSGGAGIQADLKTFTALGVYGMSAITSITAQNTVDVYEVYPIPPHTVYEQIKVVCEDIGVDAAKTGMLFSADIIMSVAKAVRDFKIEKLVVDPVMISKSGARLLKEDAVDALKEELFPLALTLTPNVPEAEHLCGVKIDSLKLVEKACKLIHSFGCRYVLIKGGHMEGEFSVDVLYDGKSFEYLKGRFVKTKNTHGTGCTFSAAISSYLAKGFDVKLSVKKARDYIQGAIQSSFNIGHGHGPLNHMWFFQGRL